MPIIEGIKKDGEKVQTKQYELHEIEYQENNPQWR